ncbi:MAG: hypothetical protein U0414_30850 [Polyangiaceae bacterium]
MAATTQRSTTTTQSSNGVDELLFHNDSVSLCLLVNRRNRTVRVIDFRAGPTLAKRNFVIAAAKREGIEKVFVLVERDEVGTWMRLGFHREGSIPGFYKRSDAWLMGAVVADVGPMRPETVFDDDDDLDDDEPNVALETANKLVEKAKRLAKDDKPVPATKIAPMKRDACAKAVAAALKANRALTAFEPFSRDAERVAHVVTGKGGFELVTSYELQPSFGSAFFEVLTSPRDEAERLLTISALRSLAATLVDAGAVSAFTMAPADDLLLSAALIGAGFRKSAVLASHIVVANKRRDAIVWAKRLVGEN